MSDPIKRLPSTFGKLLLRMRSDRRLTPEALAKSAGLSAINITKMERGEREPLLTELFRIASSLGEEPSILLVNVISAWRADPTEHLQQSRASDFTRLFRLGYHHKPGDFRELSSAYYSIPEATHAAGRLNAQRHARGVALLDTVTVYVRLTSVSFRAGLDKEVP
jgi:transcriptional regulator with XRE-family HTH domain